MILSVKDISKSYNRGKTGFYAVKPTNFTLDGGMVELCGRSGSGKTTFLSMLSGLLKPDEGSVEIDGKDIYKMQDAALSLFRCKNMGVVPQGHTGLNNYTVKENILMPALLCGNTDKEERSDELMKRLGIFELSSSFAKELSGGELRRMSVARALINEPDFVFADEPTGDLDDESTKMVLEILREYADSGKSVFVISHDSQVKTYCDDIYTMNSGEISKL